MVMRMVKRGEQTEYEDCSRETKAAFHPFTARLSLSDVDRRGSRREGIGKGRGKKSPCKN